MRSMVMVEMTNSLVEQEVITSPVDLALMLSLEEMGAMFCWRDPGTTM